MIIQHNIMAINSHRQLGINNTNLAKNLEKLSSGYRINRASDDAAGLAISEKMRAQITGLDRAILNAQDGNSLIQTAEGAMTEIHSMLNRMVELATESANGTFEDIDRGKIEQELDHLKGEINRISMATNFNGINLLDGSLGAGISTAAGVSQWAPGTTLANTKGTVLSYSGLKLDFTSLAADMSGTGVVTLNSVDKHGRAVTTMATATAVTSQTHYTATGALAGTGANAVDGGTSVYDFGDFGTVTIRNSTAADSTIANALTDLTTIFKKGNVRDSGLTMQVGDTAADFNKITVSVEDMSTVSLGLDDIHMYEQDRAAASLDVIKAAIEKVSKNRGELGALQNRLDHTIKNLGVTSENMTAAESRVRDVDMAKEMMAFTKNNVLAQAAQSMLAQANMQPQQVLQLLR